MSLIVEDGSVVDGANSYNSVSSAGTYMLNRTDPNWTSASTDAKEKALFQGGMYLNSLTWKGSKTTRDQSMDWPRVGVYDDDGFLYDDNMVPEDVKTAQIEAGLLDLGGYDLFPVNTPASKVKRKKIDVLETEFFGSAANGTTDFHVLDGLLKDFTYDSSNGVLVRS